MAAPIPITAQALAKECTADAAKAEARYKGEVLRVTGEVTAVYDDILYLKADKNMVGVRYGKGNRPAVKPGDTATFDRVAVLGPALVDGKLATAGKPER